MERRVPEARLRIQSPISQLSLVFTNRSRIIPAFLAYSLATIAIRRALGIQPAVFHMNEGHSAFLALERIRLNVVEKKLDFYSALQLVAAANVFATHTPVPAGNDSFPREMMRKYFGNFAKELNIPFDELFTFGQTRLDPNDPFSMTILALRLSRHSNGVSKLHGEVTRSLWKDVWSGVPVQEVPITSITNGVHTKTWIAPESSALYDKHLGTWDEQLIA